LLAEALGVRNAFSAGDAYSQALAQIQRWKHCFHLHERPSIFFQGTAEYNDVFSHFLASYDIPPLKPFDADEVLAIRATIMESLDLLGSLDSDARETFDIIVRALLIVRIPAFGSLSDALGIVMAGPEADWSRLEVAELLWHEAVHQALFLQDLVHPLFSIEDSALASPETCVRNPLLGVERPFDLAFHGAAVSVALLDLHLRATSHRRATELLSMLAPTIDELTARRHLLTGCGAEILDEMVDAVRTFVSDVEELAERGSQEEHELPSRRSYLELQPSWRASSWRA
jgi:hypothetical protein